MLTVDGFDSFPMDLHRDQFPVTEELIYLNHAAVAPLCKAAAEAMHSLTDDTCRFGGYHYGRWSETYKGLRTGAAALIGADPAEIAIIKNTSEGIAAVAGGISWKPGDKVVAFVEEFPANWFPWKRLEHRGVSVQWLPVASSLEDIARACLGARLLTISFVNYLSGFRVNLEAIGEICRDARCLFFVDAIQGLGAFPLDVRGARIHALAADGHKWLLGPEGCGILYVQHDVQDQIEPIEFGYTNVANFADYGSRDMTLRPNAGRYECGTLNTVGCYGLRASIDFILKVGVDCIAGRLEALARHLRAGARRKGYEVLGGEAPGTTSAIVSIRKQGMNCREAVKTLEHHKVITAPRQGWIRVSPHFYNTEAELDRMLELLP